MILRTAWKNVWRNRTRSLVVIISITIGIFAGIFAVGLMNGTIEQRVDAALNDEQGHIQIVREGFRDNFSVDLFMEDDSLFTQKLEYFEHVEGVTHRIVLTAIANTATKSTGIQVIGVDPQTEIQTLGLHGRTMVGTGSYFGKQSRFPLAYIGQDLAKELSIIRYRLNQEVLDTLLSQGLPEEIAGRLNSLVDKRFPSEKAFTKSVNRELSLMESQKYMSLIKKQAWTFRNRSKLTLTFLDRDNVQTGAMFRIAGIYDVANGVFEKSQVFVLKEDLASLVGLPQDAHHLSIVKLTDRSQAAMVAEKMQGEFPGLEAKDWKTLFPDLAMMTAMVEKFNAVFLIIILAALSFGIINTMLMVVLERTKELGMLTAIGMNKRRVFLMIMSESVFLTLVGGVVGMIISRIILWLTMTNGINFASAAEGFEAMGYSAHIYPSISNTFFITVTLLIIITGIIASIYPALKALKLDPADALRTE